MKFKIIQVNIYRGKFLDKLVEFLRSEQPDIVTMQEVTGGKVNIWPDQSVDTFQYIKSVLGMDGVVAPMYRLTGNQKYTKSSYSSRGGQTRQGAISGFYLHLTALSRGIHRCAGS